MKNKNYFHGTLEIFGLPLSVRVDFVDKEVQEVYLDIPGHHIDLAGFVAEHGPVNGRYSIEDQIYELAWDRVHRPEIGDMPEED